MPRPSATKGGNRSWSACLVASRWRATIEPKLDHTGPGDSVDPVNATVPASGWPGAVVRFERKAVATSGELRQQLREVDARSSRGDRREGSAKTGRRLGLRIKGIHMAWSAPEPDEKHALGP